MFRNVGGDEGVASETLGILGYEDELKAYAERQTEVYALTSLAVWIEAAIMENAGFWKLAHPSAGDAFVLKRNVASSFVVGTTETNDLFIGVDHEFAPFWVDIPWESITFYKSHIGFKLTSEGDGLTIILPVSESLMRPLLVLNPESAWVSLVEPAWDARDGRRSFVRLESKPVPVCRVQNS